MIRMMRGLAAGAALALASAAGGCAGYGWEDVLYDGIGGRDGTEIRGEVRDVQDRNRVIRLRRDDGRITSVRYDSRTDVIYRDRRYSPRSLDRGDYVSVRVARDSRGELHARRIVVRRSVRDGVYDRRDTRDDGWSLSARTVEGRVSRVDRRNGRFQLRADSRSIWVTLPYNPGGNVRQRFDRLRQGDYVRVSGRFVSRDRFEIERFR